MYFIVSCLGKLFSFSIEITKPEYTPLGALPNIDVEIVKPVSYTHLTLPTILLV